MISITARAGIIPKVGGDIDPKKKLNILFTSEKKSQKLHGAVEIVPHCTKGPWAVAGLREGKTKASPIPKTITTITIANIFLFLVLIYILLRWAASREKGLIRAEGKTYPVREDDVLDIKHGA